MGRQGESVKTSSELMLIGLFYVLICVIFTWIYYSASLDNRDNFKFDWDVTELQLKIELAQYQKLRESAYEELKQREKDLLETPQMITAYEGMNGQTYIIDNVSLLKRQISRSKDEVQNYDAHLKNIKHSLDTESKERCYPDFLYFSAITQATLGYGDIMTASTKVRMWVTIQIMIAVFLLVWAAKQVVTRRET